jgi:hypothetical protein
MGGEGEMDNDEMELIEAEILKHQRYLEAMERVEGEFVRSFQEAALATYLKYRGGPGEEKTVFGSIRHCILQPCSLF